MPFPVYILSGGAGSGKDTVAEMMVMRRHGVMVAQSDPMKRLVAQAFDFSDTQLWGPSSCRNAADDRFKPGPEGAQEFEKVRDRLFYTGLAESWLQDVGAPGAFQDLRRWFDRLQNDYSIVGGKTLTPRATLQLLGTEFGRAVNPDIWSQYAIRTSVSLLRGGFSYGPRAGLHSNEDGAGYSFAVITDGRFRNEILNVLALGGRAIRILNPASVQDSVAVESAGVAGHSSEAELQGIPDSWYDYRLINDKSLGLNALQGNVANMMKGFGHD